MSNQMQTEQRSFNTVELLIAEQAVQIIDKSEVVTLI